MASETLEKTGDSQEHPDIQPYLTLNFIIAIEGTLSN